MIWGELSLYVHGISFSYFFISKGEDCNVSSIKKISILNLYRMPVSSHNYKTWLNISCISLWICALFWTPTPCHRHFWYPLCYLTNNNKSHLADRFTGTPAKRFSVEHFALKSPAPTRGSMPHCSTKRYRRPAWSAVSLQRRQAYLLHHLSTNTSRQRQALWEHKDPCHSNLICTHTHTHTPPPYLPCLTVD